MSVTTKKIKLPTLFSYSFYTINNIKFFVLKTENTVKFIQIPSFISFKKEGASVEFSCCKKITLKLNIFVNIFQSWLTAGEKIIRSNLILKGLGYRVNFSSDKKELIFKLGFSHLKSISIPTDIIVTLEKSKINIQGSNSPEVGNFVVKIRNLKFPDSYKGKGILFKNEIVSLKEIKKK
jgi:ribosomal protein L6P/L9E